MTDTTATVRVGDSIFLPLNYAPPDGDLSSLQYTNNNVAMIEMTPVTQEGKPKGVSAKGLKATGTNAPVALKAMVNGAGPDGAPKQLSSICLVTVLPAIPLVTSLQLGPAAVG